MATYKGEYKIVGYYTLANKAFLIKKPKCISTTQWRRISKFATFQQESKRYMIAAPLIAQLAKNSDPSLQLISGDELLQMACDDVSTVQSLLGGRLIYLECENKSKLIEFYIKMRFVNSVVVNLMRMRKAYLKVRN